MITMMADQLDVEAKRTEWLKPIRRHEADLERGQFVHDIEVARFANVPRHEVCGTKPTPKNNRASATRHVPY